MPRIPLSSLAVVICCSVRSVLGLLCVLIDILLLSHLLERSVDSYPVNRISNNACSHGNSCCDVAGSCEYRMLALELSNLLCDLLASLLIASHMGLLSRVYQVIPSCIFYFRSQEVKGSPFFSSSQ